jgi:hypothetical protein
VNKLIITNLFQKEVTEHLALLGEHHLQSKGIKPDSEIKQEYFYMLEAAFMAGVRIERVLRDIE